MTNCPAEATSRRKDLFELSGWKVLSITGGGGWGVGEGSTGWRASLAVMAGTWVTGHIATTVRNQTADTYLSSYAVRVSM